MSRDEIGEQLATWGKVAVLETRGRTSGNTIRTAVGYLGQPDGSLLVAAGSESADWVANLRAQQCCTAVIGDASGSYSAEEVAKPESDAAVTALILKYGTPAERLGRGPVFRLRPMSEAPRGTMRHR